MREEVFPTRKLLVCFSFAVLVTMVIWVFFYVESKAFEIRSEARFKGITFAEWSTGTFRAVMLGKPSVVVEVDGGGFGQRDGAERVL